MGNSVVTNKEDIDYDKWFNFIKDNIYDLPFYKKNKWDYSQSKLETLKEDKRWIYDTYLDLLDLYAEKATDTIIDYVNKHFQAGSNEITSDTLDFIVSIFGEIIIHEFGTTNFTIIRLKEILKEKFVSERYRDVARLIFKEPTLNLAENSRVKYKFSSINSSDKKKWTDLYEQEDYDRWFTIIEENIYDLPYYKIYKSKFTPEKLQGLKKDKRWIFKTYEDLTYLYGENATDIIINYVNKHFQDGSTQIMRGTLDFIVSLFGKNIIENFVDKDLSIQHLKEILTEQLVSERYEDVARLISKEPKLNLADNSRIKYKPQMFNSLESKKFNLALLSFSDPLGYSILNRDYEKEAYKQASPQLKRELKSYEENMKKNWNICLPNERSSNFLEWISGKGDCITLPYIRKDITYSELTKIKEKIISVNQEIFDLINSSKDFKYEDNIDNIGNIYNKYNFKEYIISKSNESPTSEELHKYASELEITIDKMMDENQICFMILIITLFPELNETYLNKTLNSYNSIRKYSDVMYKIYKIYTKLSKPFIKKNSFNVSTSELKKKMKTEILKKLNLPVFLVNFI